MSTKFEQLLDFLVNEETEKANELFHEILVEKSRDIYESLIAEEEDEEEMDESADADDEEAMDESAEEEADDEEEMQESYDDEEAVESIYGEAEEEFPVQDQTDDAEDDIEAPEMGDEMGDEGDTSAPADKGDIQDLEDALEELKAEFEALMAGEKEEPEHADMFGGEEEAGEEADSEEEEGEEEKEANPFAESKIARTQGEKMREYIEKVSVSMVDGQGVGSGTGDKAGQTGHDAGKSPISSGSGKPTSGAKAIPASADKHTEDGTAPKGKVGGLVKTGGDFVKAGTKNVASSANAKKPDGSKLSGVSKPANAEGKPVGAGSGQSSVTGATNTKSIESGK